MRIVVALGRSSLLSGGDAAGPDGMLAAFRAALPDLVGTIGEHELVLTVGASLIDAYLLSTPPLDGGAAIPGQIRDEAADRLIERELMGAVGPERALASVATVVEVESPDPIAATLRPVGRPYARDEAERLAEEHGWKVGPDADGWRRLVPHLPSFRILQSRPIHWLIDKGTVVICLSAGLPVTRDAKGRMRSIEALVDEDRAWALLAQDLEADLFVMATDTDAVYQDWDGPKRRAIRTASPDMLDPADFAGDTIGPKVAAACRFADLTGNAAAIGKLSEIEGIISGQMGTTISPYVDGVTSHERRRRTPRR